MSYTKRLGPGHAAMLQPAVYIMTNRPRGVLYIGVTSNLQQRVWQHRNPQTKGFAERYHLRLLVYFEVHDEMIAAIAREKQLKKWRREWKIELIESVNPCWKNLWRSLG